MLSMAPPVLPMRKQPGLMPPTVAGPEINAFNITQTRVKLNNI
jgi:hypothetical protein